MSSSKIIKNALQKTFIYKSSYLVVGVVFIISFVLYALAIQQTGSFSLFFESTPFGIVISQIIISIINSLFLGISVAMLIVVYRQKQSTSNTTFINTVVALFFSVVSTGCYVCGTVLLPAIGIAASFATLPLGGLEIKILTALLLAYSIFDLSPKVLGICRYAQNKIYQLGLGKRTFTIQNKTLYQLRPILIVGLFVSIIVSLPFIIPKTLKKEVNASNTCQHVYTSE